MHTLGYKYRIKITFFKIPHEAMFLLSHAREVGCILAQTKQLTLNLHPTHMVKTKEKHSSKKQKSYLEHNTNYMMYRPMFWYPT